VEEAISRDNGMLSDELSVEPKWHQLSHDPL
jgi:hypothetical protein